MHKRQSGRARFAAYQSTRPRAKVLACMLLRPACCTCAAKHGYLAVPHTDAQTCLQPQQNTRKCLEECGLAQALLARAAVRLQTNVRDSSGTAAFDLLRKPLQYRLAPTAQSEAAAREYLERDHLASALKVYEKLLPHAVHVPEPEAAHADEGKGKAKAKASGTTSKKRAAKKGKASTEAAAVAAPGAQ